MSKLEKLPDYSIGAVVGMTIAAILNLGIFATKAELAEIRTEAAEYKLLAAEKYVSKADLTSSLSPLNEKVDKIFRRIYKEE